MDETRRSTDRWLPILAVALIVEALIAFSPWIAGRGLLEGPGAGVVGLALFHVAFVALPSLLGVLVLLTLRRPASRIVIMHLSFVVLVGILLSSSAWILQLFSQPYGAPRSLLLCAPISTLLAGIGASALWGTAIARIDDPGNVHLQKLGRISAGLVQVGFVFQFFSRLQSWGSMSFRTSGAGAGEAAAAAVSSLCDVVENVLLLWASVEAVRTAKDESVVRRRALEIHRLMTWWTGLVLLSILLTLVKSVGSGSQAYWIWRTVVYLTVTVTTAFLVARRYRAGYNSGSPGHP